MYKAKVLRYINKTLKIIFYKYFKIYFGECLIHLDPCIKSVLRLEIFQMLYLVAYWAVKGWIGRVLLQNNDKALKKIYIFSNIIDSIVQF